MNNTHFDDHLPPELQGIADALDRLGAAEQAAVPSGLEARVGDASLNARLVATIDQLAEADRLSAPPGLEADVFEVSRRELAGAGAVRMKLVVRYAGALRLAAALAIVASGVGIYLWSQPSPQPGVARTERITQADVDSVLAMMASIDSSTMRDQVETLAREAEGLSPNSLSEQPLPTEGGEGAI